MVAQDGTIETGLMKVIEATTYRGQPARLTETTQNNVTENHDYFIDEGNKERMALGLTDNQWEVDYPPVLSTRFDVDKGDIHRQTTTVTAKS